MCAVPTVVFIVRKRRQYVLHINAIDIHRNCSTNCARIILLISFYYSFFIYFNGLLFLFSSLLVTNAYGPLGMFALFLLIFDFTSCCRFIKTDTFNWIFVFLLAITTKNRNEKNKKKKNTHTKFKANKICGFHLNEWHGKHYWNMRIDSKLNWIDLLWLKLTEENIYKLMKHREITKKKETNNKRRELLRRQIMRETKI